MSPPVINAATTPPASAIGRLTNARIAQSPARERGLEQQEDRDQAGHRDGDDPACVSPASSAKSPSTCAWCSSGNVTCCDAAARRRPRHRRRPDQRRSRSRRRRARPTRAGSRTGSARRARRRRLRAGRARRWGVSISSAPTSASLCRISWVPHTATSKTFCSSNRFPTTRPESKVVAARRTSPGASPNSSAESMSGSTWIVGSSAGTSTWAFSSPSMPVIARRTSSALASRICWVLAVEPDDDLVGSRGPGRR